ncbi:hypothetical protein MO867_03010 [Microbulbifer sp. OS29]|uniref:Scaffold protein FimL second domain-containing protein n=1 Tax=Microbulbifer okhotskensis TaxID=2926617 RepID=A0A9X2J6B5_9GAMM|nr:hypothetical protein [Microbulbifer okhotskensis]MCO1333301.1 hypothetical protein [Microbulbifer okhotskensis]
MQAKTELRKINITSVNVVKDELVATIDNAASHLDKFAADIAQKQPLEQCLMALRQVSGVLQMVQLHAAELLAQEKIKALTEVLEERQQASEELMEALGMGFYVMGRYLDFVQSRAIARPELLIPYINNLRAARSQPPVPESHFFRCNLDASVPGTGASAVMSEDLKSFVRRFRHMYQVGLLALLRGKPRSPAYTMMSRALERIASITMGRPNGRLWVVAGAALAGMATREMRISRSRVMVFSMFDRWLRALQKECDTALDQPAPPILLKECIYWLALSRPEGFGAKLLEAFSAEPLDYSEEELERERTSLGGPGATAITAVANALEDELSGVRRMLDDVELIGVSSLGDEDGLGSSLQKVAGTLQMLNFKRVGESLRTAVAEYQSAAGAGGSIADNALQKLTGQVLMVDSTIRALKQSTSIDLDEYGHADIAFEHSQLAEAEVAVLKEAEAGLALIKRALAAYAESDFDHGHIRNVSTTLNSVRGGLIVLNLSRAASVVEGLLSFVERVIERHDAGPEVEQSLDIFADAIISLEYYLGEVKLHRQTDIQSLSLAVESLAALGYPVEAA